LQVGFDVSHENDERGVMLMDYHVTCELANEDLIPLLIGEFREKLIISVDFHLIHTGLVNRFGKHSEGRVRGFHGLSYTL
jgi:hypothetical protein